MTATEPIAEGEAIARPAFVLREEPPTAASWRTGTESADTPAKYPPKVTALVSRRHICTVSENLLLRLDASLARPTGPISLFEINKADGDYVHSAQGDGRWRFAGLSFAGSIPLYATAVRSFPPFAALCQQGGDRVGAWLASLGLARHDYWRINTAAVEEYGQLFQQRSPFYDSSAVLVAGGWHFLWPEDDFYTPPECRLLLMTQRDAEPWLKVWHGAASGGLRVIERIT